MPPFEPGQVWSYRTRPGEEASRVIILKVESHEKLGPVVHVRVEGLAVKNRQSPTGLAEVIHHMPYAEVPLAQSIVEVVELRAEVPEFADGYTQWREAFDAGQGGVWTLPLADFIGAMEQGMNATLDKQTKNSSRDKPPKNHGKG